MSVKFDAKEVLDAFSKSPRVMNRKIVSKMMRAGHELWREMQRHLRKNKSVAYSQLISSGQVKETGTLLKPEVEVTVGARHAIFVEEGTKPGGAPSIRTLKDWIKVKRIQPREGVSLDSLAFLIQRAIYEEGIKAKPFVLPALESKSDRITALLDQGVNEGLKEVFA